jgi:hypothetical protein
MWVIHLDDQGVATHTVLGSCEADKRSAAAALTLVSWLKQKLHPRDEHKGFIAQSNGGDGSRPPGRRPPVPFKRDPTGWPVE